MEIINRAMGGIWYAKSNAAALRLLVYYEFIYIVYECSPLMCAAVEVCKFAANSPTRAGARRQLCAPAAHSGGAEYFSYLGEWVISTSKGCFQWMQRKMMEIRLEYTSLARVLVCAGRLFWIFSLAQETDKKGGALKCVHIKHRMTIKKSFKTT